MEWREEHGVEWLEARLPRTGVAFSTRSAGDVREGHGALAEALSLDPGRIHRAQQVHGAALSWNGDSSRADGQVIVAPGDAALVTVADCLPVALAGPGGAALLHCGWRGLAAGIVAEGAAAVGATHAAVGPGIGPCCYEVGDEVLRAFAPLGDGLAAGRMLDLPEVTRRLLREAGVGEIESADLCTSCERERFFSHRRDGDPRRQAGVIWLEQGEG
jgi:polyphenol oxidase